MVAPREESSAEDDLVGSQEKSERWRTILDLVAARGRLSVAEASEVLGVSTATIRRDFNLLAEQQLAARTHGGIVATTVNYELPTRYRPETISEEQDRITSAAADLVSPNMVVGFNGGTTTTATARKLVTRQDISESSDVPALTLVTNALNIAAEMVLRPFVRTVTLGGVVRSKSYEVTGPLATLVLDRMWMDILFLGVDGFDVDFGASCRDEAEAEINSRMVQRSSKIVVVLASEKLGRRAFSQICPAGEVDAVVTDRGADRALVAGIRKLGVEVVEA